MKVVVVLLPHFLHDFCRKIFLTLCYILEILGNMCIVIICFPPFDIISFEININFLMKLFPYMIIKSGQKLKCLDNTQYKNGCLAASDLFHMFTQSIKFHTFHYPVLKSTDVWKMWLIKSWRYNTDQIDSQNEWLLLLASFTAKFGFVFVLTLENVYS